MQFKSYEVDNFPDRAVGIILPFNGNAQLIDIKKGYDQTAIKDVRPFQQSYSTEDQAISNLVNLLLTRKGERPMNPDLGSLIPEFVFEPNSISNRQDLRDSVRDDIAYWLPYIKTKRVDIISEKDPLFPESDRDHSVFVKIEFTVTEAGANKLISIGIGDNTTTVEIQ